MIISYKLKNTIVLYNFNRIGTYVIPNEEQSSLNIHYCEKILKR